MLLFYPLDYFIHQRDVRKKFIYPVIFFYNLLYLQTEIGGEGFEEVLPGRPQEDYVHDNATEHLDILDDRDQDEASMTQTCLAHLGVVDTKTSPDSSFLAGFVHAADEKLSSVTT